jgi:hypothetical protein
MLTHWKTLFSLLIPHGRVKEHTVKRTILIIPSKHALIKYPAASGEVLSTFFKLPVSNQLRPKERGIKSEEIKGYFL